MDSYNTTPEELNKTVYFEKITEDLPSLCGWRCFKTKYCHYFSFADSECRFFNGGEVKPIERVNGKVKIFTMELAADTSMCLKSNSLDDCTLPKCRTDEFNFQDQCYFIEFTPTKMIDARKLCKERNQTLATTRTNEKRKFLSSKVPDGSPNKLVTVGLTDEITENEWFWDGTGKQEFRLFWDSIEPNGHTSENNVAVKLSGHYIDISDQSPVPFACGSKPYLHF